MADDQSPTRRRWQFSLLSLLVLMTATCLVLGWMARPRPLEVVALIHAPAAPPPAGKAASPGTAPFIDVQQELLAKLREPALFTDAVSIVGNGKLRMFRGRVDPADWLRDRLDVEILPQSVVSITLRVPAKFEKEGIEVLDYIALRAATRVNVEVAAESRQGKRSLPNGVSGDAPRILQLAAVTKRR
jgi:hypothetical protein